MVAIEGAIIPAPLVVPPMLHPASSVCTACFATVSVVMIAVAAASPAAASSPSAAAAASTPASTAARGSCLPISPVEQTATSIGPQPRTSAAFSAVACAVWKPSGPVHAFAPPELRTTARRRPVTSTCCVHSTGAALTLLRVNTPAAACAGPSFTTRARSRPPVDLSPAATPAARNPCGVTTLTARPR